MEASRWNMRVWNGESMWKIDGDHWVIYNGKVYNAREHDMWILVDTDACDDCPLMQSTGLVDMNNVEIFESDIVQVYHSPDLYTVIWAQAMAAWFVKDNTAAGALGGIYLPSLEYEVIGNIHQHSHLLDTKTPI